MPSGPQAAKRESLNVTGVDSERTKASKESWNDLMRAAQDGDSAAYARLLSEILPLLRRLVLKKWRNSQDAEDIVQEILLSVHAVRHTYDPRRPFMPWLMTITTRRIADAARKAAARAANETTVSAMPETFSGVEAKKQEDARDDKEGLRWAISMLPSGHREAIELIKIKGLSLREASSATGKSVTALKVTIHRAVKTLRQRLLGGSYLP